MVSEKIQNIFSAVNGKVLSLIKPDRFYIALYDSRKNKVEFPWVSENATKSVWETRQLAENQLPDEVLSQGVSLHYEQDVTEQIQSSKLTYWPGDKIPASWLGVPIVFEGKTLGAIIVESFTPGAFDQRAASLLVTIAGQMATAIERARLDERLERQIKSLSVVNEVTRGLSSDIKDIEKEVLQLVYEQASHLMHTENMYIALYDRVTNMVRFPLMFVDGKATEIPPRKAGSGRTEEIISTKKPLFIETRKASVAWYQQAEREEYLGDPLASWIGVPMINRDRVIGVIAAYHNTEDFVYTEDDLHILSLLATEAAIVIDNAQLLEQERHQSEKLKALQSISLQITSQLELKELLGMIAEKANNLMGASFTTLFLYDDETHEFVGGVRRGAKDEPQFPTKKSYVYRIADEKMILWDSGNEENKRFSLVLVDGCKSKAFIGLPLIYGKNTVGVLLVNYFMEHEFSPDEKDVISLLANQAAVAIVNARLVNNLGELIAQKTGELSEKIVELEKLQGEIADKERALVLTTMTADFVHRVNNLAGTIPNWAKLAKKRLQTGENVDERVISYLEKISNEAKFFLREARGINQPLPQSEDVNL